MSLKKKADFHNWNEAKGKSRGDKEENLKLNEHIEKVRTLIADGYQQLNTAEESCYC
ncbi:MAG: hypothetical protein ACOH2A_11785 [Sphingobacteriaceae bacterium]